jgi:hypothetical protein
MPGQSYLCYKAKCLKLETTMAATDQFASRGIEVKSTSLVCAPLLPDCDAGETSCSGACVDTDTDEANCGACGNPCAGDQICTDGECTLACGVNETFCGSDCCTELEFCESGQCFAFVP